ncbi:arsenate reductase family protein [Flagellimonas okinawensis]|uniref:Arsenate reductase n=1 Tax=Flagellimonas okinawensis TaxID=3031324 RepID=A0ABT5XT90_9FLAO|nr:hypothetical protein [[Muricauda] okinawensis]MDF0709110.1 hypothetical protein [[Muricauda] okinawensis]
MMEDMGVISTDDREIKLFYNGDTNKGQQTFAYLKSSKKDVLNIDLSKTKVTATQWAKLAQLLDKPIKELVNSEHPTFIEEYGKNPDIKNDDDWLKILEINPKVLTQPILVNGEQAMQIDTPSEIMTFLEETMES